uniref:Protein SRG1 n=1 Tax=Noccaea caerulescens TaxID=107243 RepID=A0A1J3DLT5_NOCCA
MEADGEKQWSSLIVPSVLEIVKEKNFTTVPPRYVRSDQESTEVIDDSSLSSEIPVIDMKRLCSVSAMDSELEKLDFACQGWGFFQLVNHGIDSSFLDKLETEVQDFFNLSMEEKKELWQRSGEFEGFGQVNIVSEDQKLDWGDMFILTTEPIRSRKSHLFSKLPPSFRETVETYSSEVKNIAKILFAKMASVLEIKREEMEDLFQDVWQSIKINYYPPCPQPDQVMGLTPHSDAAGLTILLQVNQVEGLQIKKDGKWVLVKPLRNAFVVNVGEILEIITNGRYRSIEHRAVVNSEKERLSIAMFHSPGKETVIGPAKSLVDRQKQRLFKSMSTQEYFDAFFAQKLNGKSHLDLMTT